MKKNELRIGNWVKYSHLIENVLHEFDSISGIFENNLVSIKSRPYTAFTLDSVNPIPLTEEWLVKFGFIKKRNLGHDFFEKSVYRLYVDPKGFYLFIDHDYEYGIVEHVHELQNLYFALTGEEL